MMARKLADQQKEILRDMNKEEASRLKVMRGSLANLVFAWPLAGQEPRI